MKTVEELNEIQRQWMALDSTGPKAEIDRVCKLMREYPRIYVSGHDGKGVCMVDHQPMSVTLNFEQALSQCKEYGGRTDIAWNGHLGEWYSL